MSPMSSMSHMSYMSPMLVISNNKKICSAVLILKELGRSSKKYASMVYLQVVITSMSCLFSEIFCELLHTDSVQKVISCKAFR